MSATRTRAVLLATLMLVGPLAILPAGHVGAQETTPDVPVPFASAGLKSADLHFYRENGQGCTANTTQGQAGQGQATPFCSARIDPVTNTDGALQETRTVRRSGTASQQTNASTTVRFVMDTDGPGGLRGQGAEFPFSINAVGNAIQYSFWYDSDALCQRIGGNPQGQPLEFHMQLRQADEGPPFEGSIIPESKVSQVACGTPGGQLASSDANQVAASVDLDQPITVGANQTLIAEIYATPGPGATAEGIQWAIFFGDTNRDSKVFLRTDETLEAATWATDNTGALRDTFSPEADGEQRVMVGRLALRSPFGSAAVPGGGAFEGQIENPDGVLVDLDPSTGSKDGTVDMVTVPGTASNNDALQAYRFDRFDGTQPWQYPDNVLTGPYTIKFSGSILADRAVEMTKTVAMGAFAFDLGPVQDETTVHNLRPGTSTTFLLRLDNQATTQDIYEISTEFIFSEGGNPWSVDVAGIDQNNRISLEADDPQGVGDEALIQIELTPPDSATAGDAARIEVQATSQASDTSQNLTLEGSVTSQTTRDVRPLVFRQDRFPVGVDRTTKIRVFAWNQGTDVDTIRAGVIEDSVNTDKFGVRFAQTEFTNVGPGGVVGVPIEVTTTDEVEREENLSFEIRFSSVNEPAASGQTTVRAVVEAVRTFTVAALDGQNDQTLRSTRYGKLNISNDQLGDPAPACENQDNTPHSYDVECFDYTNWTYHRITLSNTGDLTETYDLDLIPAGFTRELPDGANSCQRIFRDTRFQSAELIRNIDHDDPGSEDAIQDDQIEVSPGETKRLYLRVNYTGQQPVSVDTASPGPPTCVWEAYNANVRVSLQDSPLSKLVETETRVYMRHPSEPPFDEVARARLDISTEAQRNGTWIETPSFVGVEPGTTETVPFTVSLQSGHEDYVELSLGPADKVDDLRNEGWTLNLTSINADVTMTDDGHLIVPQRTDSPFRGVDPISHASGLDLELALEIEIPKTGVEEDVREEFTVRAQSGFDPGVSDSIGVGVQVGKDFQFEALPGEDTVEVPQGGQAGFGLTIENTGASRDTYTVDATVSPGSFDQPDVQRQRVTVSPGSSKAVAITLDVPQGASTNTDATISVDVTAEGPTNSDEDDLTLDEPIEYTADVQQAGTLSLEADPQTVRVGPGGQNAINFTISNSETTAREVTLTEPVAPDGWTTTLTQGNVTETVPASGSETFTYLIQAPDDIVEGSTFTFMVRAEDADDASDFATGVAHATVQGETAVRLETEIGERVVDRGGNATFRVLVHNPGTSPTFYRIDTQFASAGWEADLLDQDRDPFSNASVRVPEKRFKRVLIDVQAPSDVAQGHVETLEVQATALGQQSVTDEVDLEAAIHDYAVSIEVTGATTKDAVPGDDVTYRLAITNEGNGDDRISLSFEGRQSDEPLWPMEAGLTDATTPLLEAGETLEDVTVEVQVPGPGEGPVPLPDGTTNVIRATSSGQLPDTGSPTATTEVVTRLVKYVRFDVDGDGAFEMAVDLNRDASDGFEVFADRDDNLIERGVLDADASHISEGLYALDADRDDRVEHIVDTDGDGIGEKYFDPDRAQAFTIPYTVDVNRDDQPDHPVDSDFDGRIDGLYDPAAGTTYKTVHLDFSGDGRRDLLVDANDDTFFDTFVDPNESPPIVTPANRDGDLYKLDTDDDGAVDTHYNVQTQSIEDARTANLQDFAADYWWFLLVFLIVVGLFGVIVYRRV